MAEASGPVALSTFALESCISLYEMVKSFQSHPKRVRDLLEELEILKEVLEPLIEIVQITNQEDFIKLELPLKRCGSACNEFQLEITKCLSHSGGNRSNFRDWAKIRYMGDDIDGFRRLLAGYKLTFNVVLADANLSKSPVTAEALTVPKDLIEIARWDLEAHLGNINEKLDLMLGRAVIESDSDTLELQRIQEERLSTEKCLQICSNVSQHITQIQLSQNSNSPSENPDTNDLSEITSREGLRECKEGLAVTAAKLEKAMQNIMDRLLASPIKSLGSQEDLADLTRLRNEWETIRECMNIYSKADNYLKEDITVIENNGRGDALQFMVSTNGKILHGKNQGFGWRTRQVGGYLNDASVQQLSRDMTNPLLRVVGKEASLIQDDTKSTTAGQERAVTTEYKERYGQGYKLTSQSSSSDHKATTSTD